MSIEEFTPSSQVNGEILISEGECFDLNTIGIILEKEVLAASDPLKSSLKDLLNCINSYIDKFAGKNPPKNTESAAQSFDRIAEQAENFNKDAKNEDSELADVMEDMIVRLEPHLRQKDGDTPMCLHLEEIMDKMGDIRHSRASIPQASSTTDDGNAFEYTPPTELSTMWVTETIFLGLDEPQRYATAFLMGGCSCLVNGNEQIENIEAFCEIDPYVVSVYKNFSTELNGVLAKAATVLRPDIKFHKIDSAESSGLGWNPNTQPDFSITSSLFNLQVLEEFYKELLSRIGSQLEEELSEAEECYSAGVIIFNEQSRVDKKGTVQIFTLLKSLLPPYLDYLVNLPVRFNAIKQIAPDFFKAHAFSKVLHTLVSSGGSDDQLRVMTWNLHNELFYKSKGDFDDEYDDDDWEPNDYETDRENTSVNDYKGERRYIWLNVYIQDSENWRDFWRGDPFPQDIIEIAVNLWFEDKEDLINELKLSKEYKNYPYIDVSLTWDELKDVLWEIMKTKYGFTRADQNFWPEEPAKYDYIATLYFEAVKLRLVSHMPEVDASLAKLVNL